MSNEKTELNRTANTTLIAPCSKCKRQTNHLVLASADLTGTWEFAGDYEEHWCEEYQVIQCKGCNEGSFRHQFSSSDDDPSHPGKPTFYPEPASGRTHLRGVNILPEEVRRIYSETLQALNGGQPVLSAIGIRALIETITKEKKAKGRGLLEKIDGLVTLGYLTPAGATILHKIRTLGNVAAHEAKPHPQDQLGLAIDVVENLLQSVYILPKFAQDKFQ